MKLAKSFDFLYLRTINNAEELQLIRLHLLAGGHSEVYASDKTKIIGAVLD